MDGGGAEVGEPGAATGQGLLLPVPPEPGGGQERLPSLRPGDSHHRGAGTATTAELAPACRWTNEDGRCQPLLAAGEARAGTYKLRFETAAYWQGLGQPSFYPFVEVQSVWSRGRVTWELSVAKATAGPQQRAMARLGGAACSLLQCCWCCSERPPARLRLAEPQLLPLTLPQVVFTITDPAQKLHIPLLISPYSYTTYRGS